MNAKEGEDMPTRDDYRVLQSTMYYELLEMEGAQSEEDLRKIIKRTKGRLAAAMTESEITWAENQFKKANL